MAPTCDRLYRSRDWLCSQVLHVALTFLSVSVVCCRTKRDSAEFLLSKLHFPHLKARHLKADFEKILLIPSVVSFHCPSLASPHSEVQKPHLVPTIRCLLVSDFRSIRFFPLLQREWNPRARPVQ